MILRSAGARAPETRYVYLITSLLLLSIHLIQHFACSFSSTSVTQELVALYTPVIFLCTLYHNLYFPKLWGGDLRRVEVLSMLEFQAVPLPPVPSYQGQEVNANTRDTLFKVNCAWQDTMPQCLNVLQIRTSLCSVISALLRTTLFASKPSI